MRAIISQSARAIISQSARAIISQSVRAIISQSARAIISQSARTIIFSGTCFCGDYRYYRLEVPAFINHNTSVYTTQYTLHSIKCLNAHRTARRTILSLPNTNAMQKYLQKGRPSHVQHYTYN